MKLSHLVLNFSSESEFHFNFPIAENGQRWHVQLGDATIDPLPS